MNVTKDTIDTLNARVTVELSPEDYQPVVEKTLKEHARKAKMPGFRPGKVPVSMVRKMYGPSVLVEEVNKMVGDRIYNFISEEKLDILGNPLPSEEVKAEADFETPGDMRFTFDIGLAPAIELDLDKKFKFDRFVITPTEKDIEGALENISQRSGEMVEHDTIEDNDLVTVQWVELNEDGSVKEGGVLHESSISLDKVSDDAKKPLIGRKLEDAIEVNNRDFSDQEGDRAAMLGVEKDALEHVNDAFRITIKKIQRLKPAELNEEFFKKAFPDGSVNTLEELKAKVTEDYKKYFEQESDRKLKNDIVLHLIKETEIALPDAFLKRWLTTSSENNPSLEEVEKEYPSYADGLRWQLIMNKVAVENEIRVSEEELKEGIRAQLRQQFAQYGMGEVEDEMLEDMVGRFMQNQDQVQKVNEQLYDDKVMAYFKEKAELKDKEVDSEKFYETLAKENA